ncbi:MAG: hypothetical protein J6P09_10385 [Methanobrevibacter sp.]|uniref:tetratricopeptide repeat protein n=1 Tax=Methanobrevibacter sp. TaxID=66852 RepID=UPI001B02D214|nr:tetratricopeptide repeat protein [Methanobrevibacter sp.]MBO6124232.1 hypothetical protein [Methanobrevibacter sp.]MBP3791333.1 hypothetical protein [Methanobrevibacter sp.]
MKEYLNIDNSGQTTFKVSKTSRVEYLINENDYEEALREIDKLLKDDENADNLNLKGMILDKLSQYSAAVECFDKSLQLEQSDETMFNKAQTLYDWAKVTFFPENNYNDALRLIDDALDVLPESFDASEFYFLRAEILEALEDLVESHKSYLIAYKQFDKLKEFESQTEYLESTPDTLINIVGCEFYNYSPESGSTVSLVKDLENEHDPDAIAIQVEGNTVGYVANSDYTLIDEVKSASNIKNSLSEDQKAEILFVYFGEYVIAKLL